MKNFIKGLFKPLDRPIAATSKEWIALDKEWRQNRPVRYFIEETIPDWYHAIIGRPLRNAKWWVLHRVVPKHQGHIIRLELAPGYYDPDTQLLYSGFACLRELMEDPWMEYIDWEHDEEHRETHKEIQALWNYWTIERPQREKELEKNELGKKDYRKLAKQEDEWYEKDTEMLIRLVKMRKYLWA